MNYLKRLSGILEGIGTIFAGPFIFIIIFGGFDSGHSIGSKIVLVVLFILLVPFYLIGFPFLYGGLLINRRYGHHWGAVR